MGKWCGDVKWRQAPFMCTHRKRVAGTVCKQVNTKRILAHFYVATRTICESSARNATLKNEFTLSLLHDAQIQTGWIPCNTLRDQNVFCERVMRGQKFAPSSELFHKNRHVTRGKLSLKHVPALCLCKISPSVCDLNELLNIRFWLIYLLVSVMEASRYVFELLLKWIKVKTKNLRWSPTKLVKRSEIVWKLVK